jgi:hypothetical protein
MLTDSYIYKYNYDNCWLSASFVTDYYWLLLTIYVYVYDSFITGFGSLVDNSVIVAPKVSFVFPFNFTHSNSIRFISIFMFSTYS